MPRTTAVKIETRTVTLTKIALSLAFVALAASLILVNMESSSKLENQAKSVFGGKAKCGCFQNMTENCCNCNWENGERSSACQPLK